MFDLSWKKIGREMQNVSPHIVKYERDRMRSARNLYITFLEGTASEYTDI